MSISTEAQPKSKRKHRRAYTPTTALAKTVKFADDMMHVSAVLRYDLSLFAYCLSLKN